MTDADDLAVQWSAAAVRGDAVQLRILLTNVLVWPQMPLVEKIYPDGSCTTGLSAASDGEAKECAAGSTAAVELLLEDPCWEPRQLFDALVRACSARFPGAVSVLLADPRLTLNLQRLPKYEQPGTIVSLAALRCAEVLQLLLSYASSHHLDAAAVGTEVLHGVRRLLIDRNESGMEGPSGAILNTPYCHALRIPSVLHSLVAAGRPIPSIVRHGIDVAGIGPGGAGVGAQAASRGGARASTGGGRLGVKQTSYTPSWRVRGVDSK